MSHVYTLWKPQKTYAKLSILDICEGVGGGSWISLCLLFTESGTSPEWSKAKAATGGVL